ncbi:hypothetical protein [Rhizobium halophytocola]|uniref:Uncharacterized protein n=1 Tax=Rhizobium halophytocola TaxID=735519 RepID=A0ABS4E6K4_9HYPH|nr:hypothetical protein [Rhizobium halophytocola]MBP1853576.1 hypothetical protein [Rhizobium halophytocola]
MKTHGFNRQQNRMDTGLETNANAGVARRLARMLAPLVVLSASVLVFPPSAGAVDAAPKTDCIVPTDPDQPADDQATGKDSGSAEDEQSLTETLDDCNGVLKPPVVGDHEMVEPAPDTGETPVIKPQDVPADPTPKP